MKEAIINYIILLLNRPLKLNPIYKPFYLSGKAHVALPPPTSCPTHRWDRINLAPRTAPHIARTGSILLPTLLLLFLPLSSMTLSPSPQLG